MENTSFPDWFLTEIFLRLPVKPLFQFKSVSKHWLSLISDPSLSLSYISRALSSSLPHPWTLLDYEMYVENSQDPCPQRDYKLSHNLFSGDHMSPSFSRLVFRPQSLGPMPRSTYRILAVSNGLLLCCQHFGIQPCYYSICNPVTREWINLPRNNLIFNWSSEGFITNMDGGVAKSYKVVRIDLARDRSNLKFEIFSSETGKWDNIHVHSIQPLNSSCPGPPMNFNGVLHWVDYINGIIAYDPYSDITRYRLITLPGDRDVKREIRYGGNTAFCDIHQGHLKYFEMFGDNVAPFGFQGLGMWVLEDYENGIWCLEHRVVHSDISYHSNLASDFSRRALMHTTFENLTCGLSRRALMNTFQPFDVDFAPIALHPFDAGIIYLGCGNLIVSFNFRTRKFEGEGDSVILYRKFEGQSDPVRVNRALIWWCIKLFMLPPWPTTIPKPSWGTK